MLLVVMTLVATAQSSYQVTRATLSNGGGFCTSTRYQLNGTLSQSFIGLAQNNQRLGKSGFWYQGESDVTTSNYQIIQQQAGNSFLKQNEPNPFQRITKIGFTLPDNSHVRLHVIDPLGRKVVGLLDEKMSAGQQEVQLDATALKSGTYYYQLQTDQFSETKQMVVLK